MSSTLKERGLGFHSEELIDALQLFETLNLGRKLSDHAQVSLQSNLCLADPRRYFQIAQRIPPWYDACCHTNGMWLRSAAK
jgi:hypothetical protein